MTLHAVDNKTFTAGTHPTLGGQRNRDTRSTSRYQGTCTAPTMGAMPAMPKPTAADCAEIADTQKQAQNALKSCNTMPAADRPCPTAKPPCNAS